MFFALIFVSSVQHFVEQQMRLDNKILCRSHLLQQAINAVSSQQPSAVRQHDGTQQGRC